MSRKSNMAPFVEPVYINILTDFGFKKVFLEKDMLLSFLNGIIPQVGITDITYDNTEVLGDWDTDRKAVLDLLCTTSDGSRVVVEMQRGGQQFYSDRALFYGSSLIRRQAPKGKWNYELKAVYVVSEVHQDEGGA